MSNFCTYNMHETIIMGNDYIMVREEFEHELMKVLYEDLPPTILREGKILKVNKYYYIYAEKTTII